MRELYQIFYQNNKFDTPDKIATLETYFYNIHKVPCLEIVNINKDIKKEEQAK